MTRHHPHRRSAQRLHQHRPRVNPRADESPRGNSLVVAVVAVVAGEVMVMTMAITVTMDAVLAEGHQDIVCGTLYLSKDCEREPLTCMGGWRIDVLAPCSCTQVATDPRKSGGTDRARLPFAKSGSTRRARTCSCASSPLHVSYEYSLVLPPCPTSPDGLGRCARSR